eukprot:Hpha_TRINITY_DN10438_c0_g3::TRINITY_DN10438_c0_g3_i1::g.193384::m.193384
MAAPRPLLAYNGDHCLHDGLMNENAGRVRAVVAELQRSGRWDACTILDSAPAADAVVEVLHSAQHLAALRGTFADAMGWFCATCTLENTEAAAVCAACGSARQMKGTPQFVIPEGKTSVYLC